MLFCIRYESVETNIIVIYFINHNIFFGSPFNFNLSIARFRHNIFEKTN